MAELTLVLTDEMRIGDAPTASAVAEPERIWCPSCKADYPVDHYTGPNGEHF